MPASKECLSFERMNKVHLRSIVLSICAALVIAKDPAQSYGLLSTTSAWAPAARSIHLISDALGVIEMEKNWSSAVWSLPEESPILPQGDIFHMVVLSQANQSLFRTPPICAKLVGRRCQYDQRYDAAYHQPRASPNEIKMPNFIYELEIRSFATDLHGLTDDRLDYIARLGVDAIELMPVSTDVYDIVGNLAGSAYTWGYDVAHWGTSEALGGLDALISIIHRAADRGIDVIIDQIFNHADANNFFFQFDGSTEMDSDIPALFCPLNQFEYPIQCPHGSYFYQDIKIFTEWGPRPNYDAQGVQDTILSHFFTLIQAGVAGIRLDAITCVRGYASSVHGGCLDDNSIANAAGSRLLERVSQYLRSNGLYSIAEDDLFRNTGVTEKYGFDYSWTARLSFVLDTRNEAESLADNSAWFRGYILAWFSHEERDIVRYTESHDEAARARNKRRDFEDGTFMLVLPFLLVEESAPVMIYQGQEFLWEEETVRHTRPSPFPRDLAKMRSGLLKLTRRLAGLRSALASLRFGNVEFTELDYDDRKFFSFWRQAEEEEAIIVVLNIASYPQSVNIRVPRDGKYLVLLRSDSEVWDGTLGNVGADQVTLDAICNDEDDCWICNLAIGHMTIVLLQWLDVANVCAKPPTVEGNACGLCTVSLQAAPAVYTTDFVYNMNVMSSASGWLLNEMDASDISDKYEVALTVPRGSDLKYCFSINTEDCYPDVCAQTLDGMSYIENIQCRDTCDGDQVHKKNPPLANPSRDGTIVHLFEWEYNDIAKECAALGAAGWSFVQISPPASSLLLDERGADRYRATYFDEFYGDELPINAWTSRYEPTNLLRFDSRSGTHLELEAAAVECATHGIQLIAEVVLNHMTRAPCCSGDDSALTVDCEEYSSDADFAIGMCPLYHSFPSSFLSSQDFHPSCQLDNWEDVWQIRECELNGLPDLSTESVGVRTLLSASLNEMLQLGVAGFVLSSAGLMSPEDLDAITAGMGLVRSDIAVAGVKEPLIIADVWPHVLIEKPQLQPLQPPAGFRSEDYVGQGRFATDNAWALVVGDTWLDNINSLEELTWMSMSEQRITHERFTMSTNDVQRKVRYINSHALNAFAFKSCEIQTLSIANDDADDDDAACPQVVSTSFTPHLTSLVTAWMLALPQALPRVFSSYEWERRFVTANDGLPKDARYWSGPPTSLKRKCDEDANSSQWKCEHRMAAISAMPHWRRTVADSTKLTHVSAIGQDIIAFTRSVEQKGLRRRAGWVAFNKASEESSSIGFSTGLPTGTYTDTVSGQRVRVDNRGRLRLQIGALEAIIIHTDAADLDQAGLRSAYFWLLVVTWILIPITAHFVAAARWRTHCVTLVTDSRACEKEHNDTTPLNASKLLQEKTILMAALEHVCPEADVKVTAGGLGKVCQLYVTNPVSRRLIFLFPEIQGPDYSGFTGTDVAPFVIRNYTVEVRTLDVEHDGRTVTYAALSHPMFAARTKAEIYPDGSNPQQFLEFFALWNECIACALDAFECELYHCLDYHGSLAPYYREKKSGRKTKVALTLHNALYQGSLLDTLEDRQWIKIDRALRLLGTRYFTEVDGDFNMLQAVLNYIRVNQSGRGIAAVSRQYAKELPRTYPQILYGLQVQGHPNPILDNDRPSTFAPSGENKAAKVCSLLDHKKAEKLKTQQALGFQVDDSAILVSFVGRWTYEKGLDLIADAVLWMLTKFPQVQVIVVGPIGDYFGQYAAERLEPLTHITALRKRLFVAPRFYRVTDEIRWATDISLCPSRCEPFGYVDVEFALYGALTIGALTGGLGKVPGVYYEPLEMGDRESTLILFKESIHTAIMMSAQERAAIGYEALNTSFPLSKWRMALADHYVTVLSEGDTSLLVSTERITPLTLPSTGTLSPCDERLRSESLSPIRSRMSLRKQFSSMSLPRTNSGVLTDRVVSRTRSLSGSLSDIVTPVRQIKKSFRSQGLEHELASQGLSLVFDDAEEIDLDPRWHVMATGPNPEQVRAEVTNSVREAIFLRSSQKSSTSEVNRMISDAHISAEPSQKQSKKKKLMKRFLRTKIIQDVTISDTILSLMATLAGIGAIVVYAAVAGQDSYGTSTRAMIFAFHVAGNAVGTVGWTHLATKIQIPYLISIAGFAQLSIFPLLAVASSSGKNINLFLLSATWHGMATGAQDPVFIGMNYFGTWAGHTRTVCFRSLLVTPWQTMLTYFLAAFIMRRSSKSDDTMPIIFIVFFMIVALVITLLSVLALWIPIQSHIRLPRIPMKKIFDHPAYLLLIAVDAVESIATYPLTILPLQWFLQAGWTPTGSLPSLLVTAGATAGALVFCFLASLVFFARAPLFPVVAAAQMLFPPLFILVLGLWSSQQLRSHRIEIIFIVTITAHALHRTCRALLKLRVLPSRWRYLAFRAYTAPFTGVCEAASAFIAFALCKRFSLPIRGETESDILARSMLIYTLPLVILISLLQINGLVAVKRELLPASMFSHTTKQEHSKTHLERIVSVNDPKCVIVDAYHVNSDDDIGLDIDTESWSS